MTVQQNLKIKEASARLGLSPDATRALFRDEPGVIHLNRPETPYKRGYDTMTIPPATFDRVKARLENKLSL